MDRRAVDGQPRMTWIRPIEPGDKAALAAAVDQSSDDAVYRRFLNPHGRLTAAELRYLTEVDHRDHEALVAIEPQCQTTRGLSRSGCRAGIAFTISSTVSCSCATREK